MSFELIVSFLRPIEPLLADPAISEIMINGDSSIYIERNGVIEEVPGIHIPEKTLRVAVQNVARRLGDDITEARPILDSRLPDGSRVAAVLKPCSVKGTILNIRKFQTSRFTTHELVRNGTIPAEVLDFLRTAIQARKNILISGGTSTGKTTLLNALATFIPAEERVITIEDTAEIQLAHRNLVSLEAKRAQDVSEAVTVRDLLKATLRLRPDRILLGEIRGSEAFDLLQAMNTGHSGTLSTIHADSAARAVPRFESCILQSDVQLPHRAIRSAIAESIHLLLQIERKNGKRIISELLSIQGYNFAEDRIEFQPVYQHPASAEATVWTKPLQPGSSETTLNHRTV